MTPTDRVVRLTISIVRTIAYFSIIHEVDGLISLLIRPFGRRGQGMWLRSLTGAPRVTPRW